MPVFTSTSIKCCDQENYHTVDRAVTGLAFHIHNEYGRFLDENLYQSELAFRLCGKGFSVEKELRITLTLEDFTKDYFVDLLINQSVLIETKTVEVLTNHHKAQTLNYLFLCGLNHGTLLNFRTERVQHQFVSTSVSAAKRYDVQWYLDDWKPSTERCGLLYSILERALKEWGTRLEPTLYRDVITHFLGGELKVIRKIEVKSGYGTLGAQSVHLVTPKVAFSVTAANHRPEMVKIHHQRFLSHTSLNALHWINLAGSSVSIRTIYRQ